MLKLKFTLLNLLSLVGQLVSQCTLLPPPPLSMLLTCICMSCYICGTKQRDKVSN